MNVWLPHLRGLDGLRGVAVLAVLGYHFDVAWLGGGFLGVTTFFVLSGFLIGGLLVRERTATGSIDFGDFWARRARRLVPAGLLGIALAGAYAAFGAEHRLEEFRGDALAAVFWVGNWRFIATGRSYGDLFEGPSPLQHYWTLAVEEQLYFALPFLLLGLLWLVRGRARLLVVPVGALAVASFLWGAHLHEPGEPPLRVYFGTDTRLAEPLIGVLLACLVVGSSGRWAPGRRAGWVLAAAGPVALALLGWRFVVAGESDPTLHDGELALVAILTAVVLLSLLDTRGPLARVLGTGPLVWLGERSYGIYVYHWPAVLWLDGDRTGLEGPSLIALRTAATLLIAEASYRFVEQPIRHGRLPRRVALVGWANASVATVAVVAALVMVPPASGITLRTAGERATAPFIPTTTTAVPVTTAATAAIVAVETTAAPAAPSRATSPPPTAPTTAPPITEPPPPPPPRVLVFGDSVAQNLATGLLRHSARVGDLAVFDQSAPGCPVTRQGRLLMPYGAVYDVPPDCQHWPTDLADAVASFDPDVVVVQAGFGELNDREMPGYAEPLGPGDPAFDEQVRSEWQLAVDTLAAQGAAVIWTSIPCMDWGRDWTGLGPEEAPRRVASLAAVAGRLRGVVHSDLFGVLCPSSVYQRSVLGIEDGRPDGVHLSDVAAEVLADQWLVPQIVAAAGR